MIAYNDLFSQFEIYLQNNQHAKTLCVYSASSIGYEQIYGGESTFDIESVNNELEIEKQTIIHENSDYEFNTEYACVLFTRIKVNALRYIFIITSDYKENFKGADCNKLLRMIDTQVRKGLQ